MQSVKPEVPAIVSLRVNGEPKTVPEGLSILELLATLGVNPQTVAVELNRSIVQKAKWADTIVPPTSELEIVQFVGGG